MQFFDGLSTIVDSFGTALGSAFTSLVSLFYTATESGGEPTFLGWMLLAILAITFLGFAFGFIIRIIRAIKMR